MCGFQSMKRPLPQSQPFEQAENSIPAIFVEAESILAGTPDPRM